MPAKIRNYLREAQREELKKQLQVWSGYARDIRRKYNLEAMEDDDATTGTIRCTGKRD